VDTFRKNAVVQSRDHRPALLNAPINGKPSPIHQATYHHRRERFRITVTALDAFNNIFTNYQGTVHFTSNDPAAFVPPDYTFTPADNGKRTFSVILKTAGSRTVTATDTQFNTITGSATVAVNPAGAGRLRLSVARAGRCSRRPSPPLLAKRRAEDRTFGACLRRLRLLRGLRQSNFGHVTANSLGILLLEQLVGFWVLDWLSARRRLRRRVMASVSVASLSSCGTPT
jgi:hypothetical protein